MKPCFPALLAIGALCAPVVLPAQTAEPAASVRDVAGRTFVLAARGDGSVVAWGSNSMGELGVGTRATGWTPAEVTGLANIVAVAAGSGQNTYGVSAAVRQDGIPSRHLAAPTRLDLP